MKMPQRPLLFLLFLSAMFPAPGIAPASAADPLDQLNLPPVTAQPWRFKQFPILAWWGPPGTATLADFQAYKDAGFTLHATMPDTGFVQAMEYLRQVGVQTMAFRSGGGFGLPGAKVDFAPHMDQIVGWLTHDEPLSWPGVAAAITAVNTLMREDPTRWAIFNMLPPWAQVDPSTTRVIDAAVKHGMPILSFDHYYIYADGSDKYADVCASLDLFRKASLKTGKPFWAFALTIKHFNYRRPSESDLRWMHYTNLAYGAKGLWYFTYWGPTTWEGWDKIAIVNPADGSKTELYEQVKTLNHAVLAMGDVLLGLTNEDTVHTKPPAGQRAFVKDQFWISDISAADALIGFFKDAEGRRYAMVVNKRHGMNRTAAELADTMTLTFAENVKAVTVRSWLDGPVASGPITFRDRKATLKIAGGTGVLLRAD